MAKKQKKTTPHRTPTKHQLSRWERQMKIRRIVIIAAIVFLVGISSWVGYGVYQDYKNDPMRQVVIEVNGVPFNMEYYVDWLDFYTQAYNSTIIQYYGTYFADTTETDIVNTELMRQGVESLGIEVTTAEIQEKLEEYNLPNDTVYRDMVRGSLSQEKLYEYFDPGQNTTMEQAYLQVMLVESAEVADEVVNRVSTGSNFTALTEEYSCNSTIEGDLGLLPRELMPSTLLADAAFNLTINQIHNIYNKTAIKDVGYWLIEVTGTQNTTIDALVMLLGSQAEAEQVKAALAAGGNFSTLAEEYSQHESKSNGGKISGLTRGKMGSNAFDAVAFNITPGEVSQPVKDELARTTGGYWLIRVIDRGNRQLGEEVRQTLIDKRFNDWLEERKEEGTIETYMDEEKTQWALSQILAGR